MMARYLLGQASTQLDVPTWRSQKHALCHVHPAILGMVSIMRVLTLAHFLCLIPAFAPPTHAMQELCQLTRVWTRLTVLVAGLRTRVQSHALLVTRATRQHMSVDLTAVFLPPLLPLLASPMFATLVLYHQVMELMRPIVLVPGLRRRVMSAVLLVIPAVPQHIIVDLQVSFLLNPAFSQERLLDHPMPQVHQSLA